MQRDFDTRRRCFDELNRFMHRQYALSYRQNKSDEIAVVFSPSQRLAMFKHKFNCDVLFISDQKLLYYIKNPGHQSKLIASFINRCGYKRAIFIGSSKGGFGSLLWSSLINSKKPKFDLSCLAFSPQTRVYPHNSYIDILPSYVSLMRCGASNPHIKALLEYYGDLTSTIIDTHPVTHVFYSAKNKMDRHEAEAVVGMSRITCFPLNISFHGSITAFITDISDPAQLMNLADKVYSSAEFDSDLRANLPESRDEFISDFVGCAGHTLNDAIDALLHRPIQ